ncbi:MAG TPA: MarR family transcriptional regulator [Acidisarcina sp.]
MRKKVGKGEVARFLDAWFAVRQFIQAANFNRFQGAGLSATQFMTLNLLPSDGEGVAIGELARRMNLKPATVAKTVDSLEDRGMVARVRHEEDKRVVLVHATEAGVGLQNTANGVFQAQIERLFESIAPTEREGLIMGLESVVRAAGREGVWREGVEMGEAAGKSSAGKTGSVRSSTERTATRKAVRHVPSGAPRGSRS